MKTDYDTKTGRIAPEISPSDAFEVLADRRRRIALRYLAGKTAAIHIGDLAEQIALREGTPTNDRYERICTDLVHRHLPKLVDAGVARYDSERETVQLLDAADQLGPHLDLVAASDR